MPDRTVNAVAQVLIATMDDRHKDMAALLTGLLDGGLDWAPAADGNSLADLARHILNIEGHVRRELSGGDLAWSGANGTQIDAPSDAGVLSDLLEEVGQELRLVLAGVPAQNSAALVVAFEEFDHCALHYGQMQLTRHLWEAANPGVASRYEHWR